MYAYWQCAWDSALPLVCTVPCGGGLGFALPCSLKVRSLFFMGLACGGDQGKYNIFLLGCLGGHFSLPSFFLRLFRCGTE